MNVYCGERFFECFEVTFYMWAWLPYHALSHHALCYCLDAHSKFMICHYECYILWRKIYVYIANCQFQISSVQTFMLDVSNCGIFWFLYGSLMGQDMESFNVDEDVDQDVDQDMDQDVEDMKHKTEKKTKWFKMRLWCLIFNYWYCRNSVFEWSIFPLKWARGWVEQSNPE